MKTDNFLEQLRKLNGKKEGVDDDFVPSKFKVSLFSRMNGYIRRHI